MRRGWQPDTVYWNDQEIFADIVSSDSSSDCSLKNCHPVQNNKEILSKILKNRENTHTSIGQHYKHVSTHFL